jgi:hypothetical protein
MYLFDSPTLHDQLAYFNIMNFKWRKVHFMRKTNIFQMSFSCDLNISSAMMLIFERRH